MKNKFVPGVLILFLLSVIPCVQSVQKDCGAAAAVAPMDVDQSAEKIYTLIDTDGVSFKVSQNFVNRFKMLYDFLEDTDYSEEVNKELPCPGITQEQVEFLEKLFLCNTPEQQATFADTLSFEQLFSACKALDQLGFRDQKSDDDETPHYQSFLNYVAHRIFSLDQTDLLQKLSLKQLNPLNYLALDSDFNYELKKIIIKKALAELKPQRALKHLPTLSAHTRCSSAIGSHKASPFILYDNEQSDESCNYKVTLVNTQQTPFTSHSLILKSKPHLLQRQIMYNEKYLCYISNSDNTIYIYDLVSKKETPLKIIRKELSNVEGFPDLTIKLYDKYCLVNDASTNQLYIFDLSKNAKEKDEALLVKTVASDYIQRYTITDDCKFLLFQTLTPNGQRIVSDLHRFEKVEEKHQESTLSLEHVHISYDGKYLYYYNNETPKCCFSSPEAPLIPTFVLPEEFSPSQKCIFQCFSPDSQFYLLTKETDMYIFKTEDHTLVQKITLPLNGNMTKYLKINYSFSCNSQFIRIEAVKGLKKYSSEVTLLKRYKDKELKKELYKKYCFHETQMPLNQRQQFFHKEELCIIGLSNYKTLQILDLKTNTLIKIDADRAIYQACITDENIVILKTGINTNMVDIFQLYSPLQNFILKKKNMLNCLEIITLHFAGKETQEKERKKWYPHCCGLKELINEFSHNTKANKQIITSISDSLPNPIPAKKLTPPENLMQTTDVEANFLTDCEFLNQFIEPTQAPTPQPSYTSTDAFNQRRYNAQMARANDNDVEDAFAAAVAAAVNDAVAVAEAATNNYQDSYEDVDMEHYLNDDQNHAAADDYQYDHEMELAYYNSIQDQEKRGIKRTFSEDESSSDEGDYDIDDPKGKKRRK